jgi:hypothetical protein
MKRYFLGALCGALLPTTIVAVWGAVEGYCTGFSLDCRGQAPGIQAAITSASFFVLVFSPISLLGAALGTIAVKVSAWRRAKAGDRPRGPDEAG